MKAAALVRPGLLAGLACSCSSWLRIAVMAVVDPESTTFQRSEAWRIATREHRLPWRQQWVPYARSPDNLKRAVIASEDGSFAEHDGVDWDALEKAWDKNAKAEQRAAQARLAPAKAASAPPKPPKIVGGSTITQQLAKNLLLSGERTLLRKGQELVLTMALEALLSKQRILEIYLNNVEWGEGVFGAEAAAQHYFRKPASQTERLRGRAPGRDAAAAQVLREDPRLRLPRQPRRHHRGPHAAWNCLDLPCHKAHERQPFAPAGQADGLFLLGLIRVLTGAQARWLRLPAQGRTAHLFRQPPEPCRPGADVGGPARRTAQHHAAHRGQGLLDQDAVQAMDHHGGVQRHLRGPRQDRRPGPAGAADRGADQRRLHHPVPRRHARQPRGAAALQGRPLQPGAQVPAGVVLVPAWINNVQRVMPKGEVVPVPILCSVTFGAPIAPGRR
jgi:monofunctional biosynthetic peptidoglycan transglycosylase